MDTYLKFNRKKRVSIKGDGHCLPRAIFRGAKNLSLIPEYITMSSLLINGVNWIKIELHNFSDIITESEELAKEALNTYVNDKKYNLDSNIIDVVEL